MNYEVMDVTVGGVSFRLPIDPSNIKCVHFKQYFEKTGQYEAVMVALLTKLLGRLEHPVFFDLGSFIGYYACYVGALRRSGAKVYAVESNPDHARLIGEAIRMNGLDGGVTLVPTALSDRREVIRSVGNASVIGGDEGVAVEATTLDDLCVQLGVRPNIAKMDVHGFEGKMLRGMQATLGDLQFLLLELHPNVYLERYTPGITRMQILDWLEDAGFSNYYIAGHRYTWSDGMNRFFETGRFAYQPLSREQRAQLLFDRHNQIFVLSSKTPLEDLVGPSVIDPSTE